MPQPLTETERRVLDYIVEYLRTNTYQSSIREIGHQFDIKSTKTVSELLQSLARKGWIERDPSRSRGVRLLGVELHPETVTVPWSGGDGRVEAFELDRKLAGSAGTFIVAMPDDGLSGEGIRAGDLLLVDPVTENALEDGDLVVARIGGERTVKRYRRDGDRITLESNAPGVLPIGVQRDDGLEVEGRVISVVRRLRAPRAATASSTPGGAG